MNRIYVDFNNIQDGMVGALVKDADAPLIVGERIAMTDGEDHVAQGQVTEVIGEISRIKVDLSTWKVLPQKLVNNGTRWSASAPITAAARVQSHFSSYELVEGYGNEADSKTLA